VVSYKQRKTQTRFQSLSTSGGEVWRGVKVHATKREIKTYVFFFFRMKPPCSVQGEQGDKEQRSETWFRKSPRNPVFPSRTMMILDVTMKTGFLSVCSPLK
jgi:hypothetical protein